MATLKFVRSAWKSFQTNSGLEPRLLNDLRITAAYPGSVSVELDIQKEHTNRLGTVHGGTIASLVDLCGSLVVASKGLAATGVSTDLNVTYLSSGGKVGDTLRAEATLDRRKTLAFTSTRLLNQQNELVARGSHTKFVAMAWKDPGNRVEEIALEEAAASDSAKP